MIRAAIAGVEYHLPPRQLSNAQLAAEFPEWGVEKIAEKTGIDSRHVAGPNELSSDLAVEAARKLFATGVATPNEIDYVLFCTQTPDFGLPSSACLIQHRLGIPTRAGALDFNLGCSGYVYGLSLAKGLVETGQARRVLLLTGETYTKLLDPTDKTVRTIFGDAGSATLVVADSTDPVEKIGAFVFGTDGGGAPNFVSHRGGLRGPSAEAAGHDALWMNGPEMFNFTLRVVPEAVNQTLVKAGLGIDQVDLFVFHQANRFMLDYLRKKLGVPPEKFVEAISQCGNTVSNTIPIALCEARAQGRLRRRSRVLIAGWGVGFSWAAAMLEW